MEKLSFSDVQNIFKGIISGKITREEADRWAYAAIQKNEANEVIFSPPYDKEIIWEGVMYLYGIDLRERPDEYLHSLENIKDAYDKLVRQQSNSPKK